MNNKIIAIIILATVVATVRYFKSPKAGHISEVVVGTSADFPPFSYIDQSGEMVGFDADLIRELFTRMGQPYRVENMPFETLLPQMQFNSIQVIAAGMSPTPERAARVLFSEPYIQADPLTIVTLADKTTINSLHDLHGKTVAVNQGYTADMALSANCEINIMRLPSTSDAILALQHGKADAFVTGYRTIRPLQEILGESAIRPVPIAELQESTALGVSKSNPQLLEKINATLEEMKQDGTLAALQEKWHLN